MFFYHVLLETNCDPPRTPACLTILSHRYFWSWVFWRDFSKRRRYEWGLTFGSWPAKKRRRPSSVVVCLQTTRWWRRQAERLRSHILSHPVLSSTILIERCDSRPVILKTLHLGLICPAMTTSCLRECFLPYYRKGRPWLGAEKYKYIFTTVPHPSSLLQNWAWKTKNLVCPSLAMCHKAQKQSVGFLGI